MGAWQQCGVCGGVIADMGLHEMWHREQVDDGQREEAHDTVGE